MSKDDWGDNSNAAMYDHKLAYHAAMQSLDKKDTDRHNTKLASHTAIQSVDNKSTKIPYRRVQCNCKKCMINHSMFCKCVMCVGKRIEARGFLPSTIEYNTKVAIVNKTISIKAIVHELMKEVLVS